MTSQDFEKWATEFEVADETQKGLMLDNLTSLSSTKKLFQGHISHATKGIVYLPNPKREPRSIRIWGRKNGEYIDEIINYDRPKFSQGWDFGDNERIVIEHLQVLHTAEPFKGLAVFEYQGD